MKRIVAIFSVFMVGILSILSIAACQGQHEHSFSPWEITKSATCEQGGKRQKVCTVCGYVVSEDTPMLGHNFVHGKCTDCGASEE